MGDRIICKAIELKKFDIRLLMVKLYKGGVVESEYGEVTTRKRMIRFGARYNSEAIKKRVISIQRYRASLTRLPNLCNILWRSRQLSPEEACTGGSDGVRMRT